MNENNQPADLIENALLQQFIQQGDDDAFSKLQLLLRSRLQGYAYKLLRDSHQAEDTVQESFLKLYQQRESLQKALADGRSITVAWLFTTARRSAIDELRKIGLHKETSFESLKEEGKDPEIQGTSVSENPARHPHDYSNLGLQPPPSVEELLKVIGETEEMADDEIDNLRKLLQPHLWRPVRGKTAKGFPRKDKFDYQLFAHEEGITEAAAYKMMSRLRTDKFPGFLRRVGGLAALRTLASRALAWMRSLANRRGLVYAIAGLATMLIPILMWLLLNDRTERTSATELLTVSSLIATQMQGQSASPANLNQSQPRRPDNTQEGGRPGSNLRAEVKAYPNMPAGIRSVEVLVFYREDKMTSARIEVFSQTLRRFVKGHAFSSVQPQANAARNDVKGTIIYDQDAGSDMRECAEFVRTILNEAESGLKDKFFVMGVGGGGIGGADSAPSTPPSAPVQAPRVVKVTLPEVHLP